MSITPYNIEDKLGYSHFRDNTTLYVKYIADENNFNAYDIALNAYDNKNNLIKNIKKNSIIKISVLDMRIYPNFWMIAGKILNEEYEERIDTFYYPRDKFWLKNIICHKNIYLLFVVCKFYKILRRVRIKKTVRLFLLSTCLSNDNKSINRFIRGSSNLPIRKCIVDYLIK